MKKVIALLLASTISPIVVSAADPTLAIGDTGCTLTIKQVQKSVAARSTPQKGHKYLGLDIMLVNGGQLDIKANSNALILQDSNSYVYEAVFLSELQPWFPFSQITLKPGDKVRGWIAFQVPKSADLSELKLKYEDHTVSSGWTPLK